MNHQIFVKTYQILLFSIFLLLLGIFIGKNYSITDQATSNEIGEKHSGQRRLTNKLLDYDIPPSKEMGSYKLDLDDMVNKAIINKHASSVGVYYRDLNNGPWVGSNHAERFIPASLLKVPIMMTYFKQAETDSSIFSRTFRYDSSYGSLDKMNYPSKIKLEEGKEYTVDELIRRMIVHSDNGAMMLLSSKMDMNVWNELFKDLGIVLPSVNDSENFISARQIGSFFRVLYNATYLNEAMSEKALQLLTETDFDKGIVAGIPPDVTAAQKFGERTILDEGVNELHDCGIVYYPHHPYILCIMTKGDDFKELTSLIANISKLTYEYVKKSNSN